MTNLDGLLQSRDIILPTKVHLVKAMAFPVVRYVCESWPTKKAEPQRIDAFKLWCWIRLLRIPWTARKSNQFILKEISPEYSLEGLMLKLKLQYSGHWCKELTHWKRPRCWERLKVGGKGDNRGWDGWMTSQTQWTWVWVNCRSWWWIGSPGMLQSMESQRIGHDWVTELDWTEGPWTIAKMKCWEPQGSSGCAFFVLRQYMCTFCWLGWPQVASEYPTQWQEEPWRSSAFISSWVSEERG